LTRGHSPEHTRLQSDSLFPFFHPQGCKGNDSIFLPFLLYHIRTRPRRIRHCPVRQIAPDGPNFFTSSIKCPSRSPCMNAPCQLFSISFVIDVYSDGWYRTRLQTSRFSLFLIWHRTFSRRSRYSPKGVNQRVSGGGRSLSVFLGIGRHSFFFACVSPHHHLQIEGKLKSLYLNSLAEAST
jgi:hypothetical protein